MRDKDFDAFPQTDISTEKATIDALNQESWHLREIDIKKAIGLAQRAHQLSLRLQDNTIYERGLAYSCAHLGYFHYTASQYEDALIRLLQARKMFLAIEEPLGEAEVLVHTALVYWGIGEYDKAFGLVFDAISLSKQDENSPKVAWYYFTLGTFYSDLKDFDLSLQYYDKAIYIFEEGEDRQGITRCKNGIGNVYESLNNYEEALQAHQEAYSIQETNGFRQGMARSLHDIGNIHFKLNNYKKALSYYEESLQIRKKLQAKQSIITSFLNLGKLYTKTKDYKKALVYLKNALELAEEIKARPKMYQVHEAIAGVYKLLKDPWLALEHYEQFVHLRAAILGEEVNTRIKNLQTSFLVEKSEKEAEIYKESNQKLIKAYKEIETKNKQVFDSIHYAKRIQEAIMTDKNYIFSFLKDAFIYYQPKDIVSGDFYWFGLVNDDQEYIMAAVDCTGHGVPGAFMTVLANSLLNQIINEMKVYQPAEILTLLDQKVTATLQKQGSFEGYYQGLDIALCKINLATSELIFAGAKRPLYYVRAQEMHIVKGTNAPIGASQYKEAVTFEEHTLPIQPNDVFYIFSDGYQDQFGEKEGRKLMLRHFRELLFQSSDLPMQEQAIFLDNFLQSWRASLEQTDDILVVGIRF